jgi:hypothetical protein
MNHATFAEPFPNSWKDLYVAALFENDKAKIGERISEAQVAIASRRSNLTVSADDVRERHALDNALFSLEALGTCLAIMSTVLAVS